MNVVIHLFNAGYAPLYNKRTAYLVLKNGAQTYSLPLTSDPRRWQPGHTFIMEQPAIPSEVKEGTYRLYLWMPDQYESIKNNPRYAIRFGNEDVWDETTGYNDLHASIVISKDAPADPGDLPILEALNDIRDAAAKPSKRIGNGQLLIRMPDGRTYSILGQMIQ